MTSELECDWLERERARTRSASVTREAGLMTSVGISAGYVKLALGTFEAARASDYIRAATLASCEFTRPDPPESRLMLNRRL
jgi:hypothetical protein